MSSLFTSTEGYFGHPIVQTNYLSYPTTGIPKSSLRHDRIFGAVQILVVSNQRYAWVTWPESPKGTKDDVKEAQRAPSLLACQIFVFLRCTWLTACFKAFGNM